MSLYWIRRLGLKKSWNCINIIVTLHAIKSYENKTFKQNKQLFSFHLIGKAFNCADSIYVEPCTFGSVSVSQYVQHKELGACICIPEKKPIAIDLYMVWIKNFLIIVSLTIEIFQVNWIRWCVLTYLESSNLLHCM